MTCLRANLIVNNECIMMLIVKIKRMNIDYTMSFEQHIELNILYSHVKRRILRDG